MNSEWENYPLEVHHLDQKDFDHGGTRKRAELSTADIMVFMTQDALPADRKMIGNLVRAVSRNSGTGAAYARQLPKQTAFSRNVIPVRLIIRNSLRSNRCRMLKRMESKLTFCSNACAAYDREIYQKSEDL